MISCSTQSKTIITDDNNYIPLFGFFFVPSYCQKCGIKSKKDVWNVIYTANRFSVHSFLYTSILNILQCKAPKLASVF